MARGSIFDQKCVSCAQRVMVAPSGQAFLDLHPDADIICAECFVQTAVPETAFGLAATADQIAAEIKEAVPNEWRSRN